MIKHKDFRLLGRKALIKAKPEETMLIDVSESPVERPKKNQKPYYSGKKKRHTIKTQLVVNKATQKVVCTSFEKGKVHDFRILKESKTKFAEQTPVLADSGYQGLQKLHGKTKLPYKRKAKQKLPLEHRKHNRDLASNRALNENVIGALKRFRIIADRYRNRRRRFGLRVNLIAAIYNMKLTYKVIKEV